MTLPPAQPDPVAVEVLATLVNAGVRLAPNGPNVRYWSPAPLAPELRELIVAHKAAIIAALSIWCPKRALRLQVETDGLVADLGVDGTDPEIVAAAERYSAARDASDMAGVRLAVFAIEVRARKRVAATSATG